jgi:cobalt-zinc-cadmium efflux system protein
MLAVAAAGFIANMIAVYLLRQDKQHNLNVKSVYVHLLGDSLASAAVIVGSVVIIWFKIYWIDPALSILVGLFILRQTYKIIRQAVDILMQSTPERLDLMEIKKEIEKIKIVSNIHHVHAWTLDDSQLHFECHIDLKQNYKLSELEPIRKQIENMLHGRFNISHFIVQFEFDVCHDKEMLHHL